MSSDEEFDNLPNITLFEPKPGCSKDYDEKKYIIPPAEDLVTEREKMRKLKLELQSIDTPELENPCDLDAELLEAGLIEVQGSMWPEQRPIPTARELWTALDPHLSPRGIILDKLPNRLPKLSIALMTDTGDRIVPPADFGWTDPEMLAACFVTLVASLARESHIKRIASTTLQTLLDYHANPNQVSAFLTILVAAFPDARMRRDISDLLANGSRLGADRVATSLCYTALLSLIHVDSGAKPKGGECSSCAPNGKETGAVKKDGAGATGGSEENGKFGAVDATNVVKTETNGSGDDTRGSVSASSSAGSTSEAADEPVKNPDLKLDVMVVIKDLSPENSSFSLQRVAEVIPYWGHCTDAERYEVLKLAGRIMADSMSPHASEETIKARKLLLKNLKETKTQNATPYHQYKERMEINKLEMLFSRRY